MTSEEPEQRKRVGSYRNHSVEPAGMNPEQHAYVHQRQRYLPVVKTEALPSGRVLKFACTRCNAIHMGKEVISVGGERVTVEKYSGGVLFVDIESAAGNHSMVRRCNCEVGKIYFPNLPPYDAEVGTIRGDTVDALSEWSLERRWRALLKHNHPEWSDTEIGEHMRAERLRFLSRGKDAKGLAAAVVARGA